MTQDVLYKVLDDAYTLLIEIGRRGLASGGEQSPNRAECFDVARRVAAAQERVRASHDVSKPLPRDAARYDTGSMTSNTPEVWRRMVGQRIVGAFMTRCAAVIVNGAPATLIWLVTPSGAALVFNSNSGAYWRASASEVAKEVAALKEDLDAKIAALRDVIALAGA